MKILPPDRSLFGKIPGGLHRRSKSSPTGWIMTRFHRVQRNIIPHFPQFHTGWPWCWRARVSRMQQISVKGYQILHTWMERQMFWLAGNAIPALDRTRSASSEFSFGGRSIDNFDFFCLPGFVIHDNQVKIPIKTPNFPR